MSQDGFKQQALQAMREQKLDEAVELLVRAIIADDRDSEAKALLGLAYSQKGLHTQAIRALQTATELTPQNPQFGYHLGQAHERAGNAEAAARAYAEVSALHPGHAPSRARLQAMGPVGASALAGATAAAPPEITLAGGAMPASYAPASHATPDATRQINGAADGNPSGTGPAMGEQTIWAPAPQPAGGPGDQTLQTGAIPHAATATAPWATPPGTQYMPPVLVPPDDDEDECPEDTLNPVQSLIDWMQLLIAPGKFFHTQQLADGLKSPFMFILLMGFFSTPGLLLQASKQQEWPMGLSPELSALYLVFLKPITLLVNCLIVGVALTLVAGWFNGTGTYLQSCRVLIYATGAPMPIITLLAGVVALLAPGPAAEPAKSTHAAVEIRLAALQLPPGSLSGNPSTPTSDEAVNEGMKRLKRELEMNPNNTQARQRLEQLFEQQLAGMAGGSGFNPQDPAVAARMEQLQQEMETNPARREAAQAEYTELLRREQMPSSGLGDVLEELEEQAERAEAEDAEAVRKALAPSNLVILGSQFVMWIWAVVLTGIGIAHVHEMESWDAIKTMWLTGVFMRVIDCFLSMAAFGSGVELPWK